jgi:hypothetical protein
MQNEPTDNEDEEMKEQRMRIQVQAKRMESKSA